MNLRNDKLDTIAAIATGTATSAIGIVRVSGDNALTAADNIFRTACGVSLKDLKDRHLYYGELIGADGELIDLCLCVVSRAPNSYTGENTVEFHCHGSPVVLSEVLRALFKQGVRQAEPGEFTKRAFLNGRMDLTQAEAVIDLIESETPLAAQNAARQLGGAVCEKMNTIYDKLVDIMAHFHAVIDYPDEDIEDFKMQGYLTVLRECEEELRRMLGTHERGRVLRSGIPTAIVGRTNTGKSSLLNALLGYERAIVTDIHGTTRDTIEEKVLIGKVLLRLIDTAGLRQTDDTVEKLGVQRTLDALQGAGFIIVVFDGSKPLTDGDMEVLRAVQAHGESNVPKIAVINKSDLFVGSCGDNSNGGKPSGDPCGGKQTETMCFCIPEEIGMEHCAISALTGEGLSELEEIVQRLFPDFSTAPKGEIITSVRQAEALCRAIDSLTLAEEALTAAVTPDAVLTDIEAALFAIGEVTGKTTRDDIVARIFERFCVGK